MPTFSSIRKWNLRRLYMLNPIKAFNYVNSTIQSVTGYSFSPSNLHKNINKIALPAIALVTGMYVVSAEDLSKSSLAGCCCSYDDCISFCAEGCLKYNENFFHELGKCVRICVTHFP